MAYRNNVRYRDVLTSLGLVNGLQLCLDAGDIASYASGTTWNDTATTNNFFLGIDATAANDPTFTGTAGNLKDSTYWLMTGTSLFRLATANPAWVDNIHKDSARFTLACWVYIPALATLTMLAGDDQGGNPTDIGFFWDVNSSNQMVFQADNGIAGAGQWASTAVATVGWNFLAISLDEGSGNGLWQLNATSETFSATYTTPSAATATRTVEIGACGNTVFPMPVNTRVGAFMGWSRNLSATELMNLYQYPPAVMSGSYSIHTHRRVMGY
jgi:hypothetical protein